MSLGERIQWKIKTGQRIYKGVWCSKNRKPMAEESTRNWNYTCPEKGEDVTRTHETRFIKSDSGWRSPSRINLASGIFTSMLLPQLWDLWQFLIELQYFIPSSVNDCRGGSKWWNWFTSGQRSKQSFLTRFSAGFFCLLRDEFNIFPALLTAKVTPKLLPSVSWNGEMLCTNLYRPNNVSDN